jgi:hypothetical protein
VELALIALVFLGGLFLWTRFSRRGRGGTEVLRLLQSTPKGQCPEGARSFGCGFKVTEPGAVVSSTGTARCFVSSHRICIEGWLGALRFDRGDTRIRAGGGRLSRYVELANSSMTIRVLPTWGWRSAQRLLEIHGWLPSADE